MPQYVSCVDLEGVTLGLDAGAALTSGVRNVLLGPGAGSALTTGSGNVVIGAAPGGVGSNNTIVLSTASSGAVRAQWDGNGNVQLALNPMSSVTDPAAGYVTLGYDPATNMLVFKHNDGTAVRTSAFRPGGPTRMSPAVAPTPRYPPWSH